MPRREHHYAVRVTWEGARADLPFNYDSYSRQYRTQIAGKPDLLGSADPAFRGDPARHNPEDLFVTAISTCHMLTYLALCARNGVHVLSYEDSAEASMHEDSRGGGRFESVQLRPTVTVATAEDIEAATRLHDAAHERCFISASCDIPIHHSASVRVAERVSS